jgi:hypothetical protein
LPFIGGILVGLGLAAIQLLPMLELIPLSERGGGTIETTFAARGLWLSPSRLFATFIFPAYHFSLDHFLPYISTTCWVGPVPILLAGYALRFRRRVASRRVMLPLLVSGLIFLYLAMGSNAPLAGAVTSWGPLGHFRGHGRLSGYFAISMLGLMAIGLDILFKTPFVRPVDRIKHSLRVLMFAPELIVMGLLAIPFITHRAGYIETRFALWVFLGFLTLFFAGLYVGKLVRSRIPVATAVAMVVAIQIIGFRMLSSESLLLRANWEGDRADILTIRYESSSEEEAAFFAIRTQASVRLHDRIVRNGLRAFSFQPKHHIDHLGSANAGIMENLTMCNADIPLELARWEWLVHRNLWERVDKTSGNLSIADEKLLWFLGVNWIVTENGSLEVTGFERMSSPEWVNGDVPFYIYRRISPVGIYEIYHKWEIGEGHTLPSLEQPNDEEAIRNAFHEFLTNSEIKETVLIEGTQGASTIQGNSTKNETKDSVIVSNASWVSPTEYSATVSVSDDAIFMLRDQWYPGWEVVVNGEAAQLLRANLVFKAVKVPTGENEIVFRYKPNRFKVGWLISWVSLLVLVSIIILRNRLPR